MKYIVVESLPCGIPAAILFNEALNHKDVAGNFKVHAAGFCNPAGEVWGHSESLGIQSRPADSAHVRVALAFNFTPKPEAVK